MSLKRPQGHRPLFRRQYRDCVSASCRRTMEALRVDLGRIRPRLVVYRMIGETSRPRKKSVVDGPAST